MGLSKKFVNMKKNKRAEMGVGTMIIFIAMVLVAAVAASVLISTANTVREQAQQTGDQAINGVATGFLVQDVIGEVNQADYQSIDNITIYLKLNAGSPQINMNNVVITLISNDNNQKMEMGTAVDSATFTAAQYKQVSGNSWDASMDVSHVVGQGDLIKVTISNDANALGIGANEKCTITIQPAYGSASNIMFVTDEAFAPNVQWVSL